MKQFKIALNAKVRDSVTGFAGTVSKENINEISYYNFSGRNKKSFVSVKYLEEEICHLINDHEYYEQVRYFGKAFVYKNVDIRTGIEKIESVYKMNIEYYKNAKMAKRFINLIKIITSILIDNYY